MPRRAAALMPQSRRHAARLRGIRLLRYRPFDCRRGVRSAAHAGAKREQRWWRERRALLARARERSDAMPRARSLGAFDFLPPPLRLIACFICRFADVFTPVFRLISAFFFIFPDA